MSISVNGQSQVPPGFRFHPTEEELLQYYLRKKVAHEKIDLDVIRDVDLNKLEPWDIQEKCKIGSTPQNDWYFFSHKDKKYPTGTRTNRATAAGFWKATGRDKVICSNSRRIGMRKTLVFYRGRAPHGQKSDWIMHEYRLEDNNNAADHEAETVCHAAIGEPAAQEEGWVVCRIFKKKNHHKTVDSPIFTATCSIGTAESTVDSQRLASNEEGTLEKLLEYMGSTSMDQETEAKQLRTTAIFPSLSDRFMKLPSLESPKSSTAAYRPPITVHEIDACIPLIGPGHDLHPVNYQSETSSDISDWAALDRLLAENETAKQLSSCFGDPTCSTTAVVLCCPTDQDIRLQKQFRSLSSEVNNNRTYHDIRNYHSECELWGFARSSLSSSAADPLSHMPNLPV